MSIAKIDNGEKGRFVGRLFGFFLLGLDLCFSFSGLFQIGINTQNDIDIDRYS
jgi:hypothetical protein